MPRNQTASVSHIWEARVRREMKERPDITQGEVNALVILNWLNPQMDRLKSDLEASFARDLVSDLERPRMSIRASDFDDRYYMVIVSTWVKTPEGRRIAVAIDHAAKIEASDDWYHAVLSMCRGAVADVLRSVDKPKKTKKMQKNRKKSPVSIF